VQIWDDKSSANLPGPLRLLVGSGGMMGTHDELTRAYFQARPCYARHSGSKQIKRLPRASWAMFPI
jgi:hypothetical protein